MRWPVVWNSFLRHLLVLTVLPFVRLPDSSG